MRRANKILLTLCVVLALTNGWVLYEYLRAGSARAQPAPAQSEEPEPELASYMATLQQYTHKLALSAAARNERAAGFYLHELEEMNETIVDDVPSYEGHAIGPLTETMLVPQVEAVEAALDAADWARVDAQLEQLVQSCNQCHQATEHGFIRIAVRTEVNPFAQSFAPSGAQGS